MDDLVTLAILAASGFFVVLAGGLLFRYRQVSRRISVSTDQGLEMWEVLESRLRKQDERILDVMGRMEVIQARSLAGTTAKKPASQLEDHTGDSVTKASSSTSPTESQGASSGAVLDVIQQPSPRTTAHTAAESGVLADVLQWLETRLSTQEGRILELANRLDGMPRRADAVKSQPSSSLVPPAGVSVQTSVDKVSYRELLSMLDAGPKTSVEIRERFAISREHAARVLKELFDRGLVQRNDSRKPFVYELTDQGRSYLQGL